ncbi:MAG TPA: SCO family protein [Candidatus Methylacidiphilales bacterium]|nr:SCO family protein [Candidatus Methylacidiphilales bacterium]
MRLNLVLAFYSALLFCATVRADSSTPIDYLRDVRFDQKLGTQVPLDLPFVSETGAPVQLGDYFHKRPIILILDYNRCPNLCSIVFNSLITSLKQLTFNAGDRFDVVAVSIDPTDTPATSAIKKLGYVDSYQRPETAQGWHFLTGSPQSIKTLADAVGFHYVYVPAINQYAHPSGIVILTPGGRVSRYFFGIEYPPADLRDALATAADAKVGNPVEDFLLLCCQYNPLQGKYGVVIFNILRLAGILMVAALAAYVFRAIRQETRQRARTEGRQA